MFLILALLIVQQSTKKCILKLNSLQLKIYSLLHIFSRDIKIELVLLQKSLKLALVPPVDHHTSLPVQPGNVPKVVSIVTRQLVDLLQLLASFHAY